MQRRRRAPRSRDGDWKSRDVKCLDDFFKEPLKRPPGDFSSVVWHPSAGMDWSPFVFWSKGYLTTRRSFSNLTPASLHVMTTMGCYEDKLMEFLESADNIAWQDDRTIIRLTEYEFVSLRREDLWQKPSRRHFGGGARGEKDVFRQKEADGFSGVVEVVDKECGKVERIPMLYLLSENIATYEHFVSSGLFRVRHIKAACEGLAMGGCGRSLLDYLAKTGLGIDGLESVWAELRLIFGQGPGAALMEGKRTICKTMAKCFGGSVLQEVGREVTNG